MSSSILDVIQAKAARCVKDLGLPDTSVRSILVACMAGGVLLLDLYHLLFMVLGAVFFCILQTMQPETKKKVRGSGQITHKPVQQGASDRHDGSARQTTSTVPQHNPTARPCLVSGAIQLRTQTSERPRCDPTTATPSKRADKKTVAAAPCIPVSAPVFSGHGLTAEVAELLSQIQPTVESAVAVEKLAKLVADGLRCMVPDAEVVGFANGDLSRGKAFGVAVPDVDLVVTVSLEALVASMKGRRSFGTPPLLGKMDALKLQKSAIRAITEQLVWGSGFKFRRSAFRGLDPKVTLLSPTSLTGFEDGVPVDIYVNAITPLYCASLLCESGRFDVRARELIFLVRRWAKDRGVCHAAKGHLSPYMWHILTIYFLQVGVDGGEQQSRILPGLGGFPMTCSLATRPDGAAVARAASSAARRSGPATRTAPGVSTGDLFKQFLAFYNTQLVWGKEVVSIRTAKRTSTNTQLPLHSMPRADGKTFEVGLSLEDPFDPKRNLASCMNIASLDRLKEELARSVELCERNASLTEILEPWIPEQKGNEDEDEE